MENKLKQICLWINDVAQLSKTIEQNKMSSSELKALLQIVDVKRKGYLDLNDVYELAGKVTENQLFTIFKFLDTERTGEIRLEELERVLGNPESNSKNNTKEYIFPRFYKIIDTVKDMPKLAGDYKKKYGFNQSNLKATYQYISSLVQSKYLNCQELITVLKAQSIKYGMRWGQEHEKIIKQFLPDSNVSQTKFIQFLNSENNTMAKIDIQEECLLSGIETQNSNIFKPKVSQVKVNPITLNKSSYDNQSNPSIIYKKNNNFFENPRDQSPSFRPKPQQTIQYEYKDTDHVYRKKFTAIEGNVNQVVSSIQQRRQKLRQDSLDRKKLIEDVMNRKRQFCSNLNTTTQTTSNSPQTNWKGGQDFYRRVNQSSDNSKSYLNKSFQNGASSYKQPIQPQNAYPYKTATKSPQFYRPTHQIQANYIPRGKSINDLKLNLQRDLSISVNQRQNRPFTPLNSQPKYQINQILSKYNNYCDNNSKTRQEYEERLTLKQLCKSKSGFIYSQPQDSYQMYSKQANQFYQTNEFKYQREHSNSKGFSSKENVLKRAEQQANKKIEEIQRKARMKVLEKKSMARNGNKQEWGKLMKRGSYY